MHVSNETSVLSLENMSSKSRASQVAHEAWKLGKHQGSQYGIKTDFLKKTQNTFLARDTLQPEPRNAMAKTQDRATGRQLRTQKKPPVLLKIHKQTFSISSLIL